jgi:hypothetical protein
MQPKIVYTTDRNEQPQRRTQTPCIGKLAGVSETGDILVCFDGKGPRKARFVSRLSKSELVDGIRTGVEVLLVFDRNDPEKPIITDMMAPDSQRILRLLDLNNNEVDEPVITEMDGKQLTVEAKEQVTLRCGKGSITIQRDGKIIVRGTQIVSRASGANKIMGASVRIN